MGTNIFRAVNSTLIYLERGDEYLMLHRTKRRMTSTTTNGSAWAANLRTASRPRTAPCAKRGRRPV